MHASGDAREAVILQAWRLFWALALGVSGAISFGLSLTDLHTARGTEFIIQYSVLCALPCLLVAFTASSFAAVWPNRSTRWLLSNRRYFGLAFAFGMAWHFSFVAYYVSSFGNPLRPLDLALDFIGLSFLLAMTLTSFRRFARRLSPANWRRLHKTGIYTLWLLPTYFYLDDFGRDGDTFYLAMFSVLLAAAAVRIIACSRQSTLVRQVR